MEIWPALIGIGGVAVAALALLDRVFGKTLTRGEHAEFKEALLRDITRIEQRINYLDQSRPTVVQMQEALALLRDQLEHMRELIQNRKN